MRAIRTGVITAFQPGHVEIELPSGAGSCLVPWHLSGGIDRLPDGIEPTNRVRRRRPEAALRGAVFAGAAQNESNRTVLSCLLVGPKSKLEDELELPISADGVAASGTLASLLRPHSMLGAGDAFQTDVVASTSASLPRYLARLPPASVILDGSPTLLRWLGASWDCPVLSLLDRTDGRSVEAGAAIESERAQAAELLVPGDFPAPPLGVEAIGYTRGGPGARAS